MVRLALLLEYDGAAFSGSQRQPHAPTVQAALEAAIARLTGAEAHAAFAGRTDAGVHASGQVAAFSTEAARPLAAWQKGLNALLPEAAAVRAVAVAPETFDPRRHARARLYRYQIWNSAARSPLRRNQSWHVWEPLDHEAMATALGALEGEHDFTAFGGALEPGRSAWRRIFRTALCRRGPLLTVELEGSAFLPHQVRRTVGALVEIGRGALAPESFAAWLRAPRPHAAGPAAPPQGLCLARVMYDNLRFSEAGEEEERE